MTGILVLRDHADFFRNCFSQPIRNEIRVRFAEVMNCNHRLLRKSLAIDAMDFSSTKTVGQRLPEVEMQTKFRDHRRFWNTY